MPDFNVRSDSVNVEQIMEQIRARIREKRGVDYTEDQIRELASVKLEKFLDPRGIRSDLIAHFGRAQPPYVPPELPNYAFEEDTLFESHRGPLRLIRKLLRPILKLFFNPNPLIQALHVQAQLNTMAIARENTRENARRSFDQLQYEILHNLVVETTRLGMEIKNLKMRVESLTSRLEFNERRARALESVVVYKPSPEDRVDTAPPPRETPPPRERETRPRDLPPPREPRESREPREPRAEASVPPREPAAPQPSTPGVVPAGQPEGPGQRSRRRRRRRGRRGGGSAQGIMGGGQPGGPQDTSAPPTDGAPHAPESMAMGDMRGDDGDDGDADHDGAAQPDSPDSDSDQDQ